MPTKPTSTTEWASSGSAATDDPGASKQALGWVVESPSHQTFNWWMNTVYEWIKYLEFPKPYSTVKDALDNMADNEVTMIDTSDATKMIADPIWEVKSDADTSDVINGYSVAADGQYLFVGWKNVTDTTHHIYIMNPNTGAILNTFTSPGGRVRALHSDGKVLLVAAGNKVYAYDIAATIAAEALTANGTFSASGSDHGAIVHTVYSDGLYVYLAGVAGTDSKTIRVLNRSTGAELGSDASGATIYGLVVDGAEGSRSHDVKSGTGFIYTCGDLDGDDKGIFQWNFTTASGLAKGTGLVSAGHDGSTKIATNQWTSITQSKSKIYVIDDGNNIACFSKDFAYHAHYYTRGGTSDELYYENDPVWYAIDVETHKKYAPAIGEFDDASDDGVERMVYLNGYIWLVGEKQATAATDHFDLVVLDAKTGHTVFAGIVGNYADPSSYATQYGIATDGASIYITGDEDDTGTTYYFTRKLYSPMQPTMIKKHAGTERFRSPRHILCTVTADEVD